MQGGEKKEQKKMVEKSLNQEKTFSGKEEEEKIKELEERLKRLNGWKKKKCGFKKKKKKEV